jgi:hypothetical protein
MTIARETTPTKTPSAAKEGGFAGTGAPPARAGAAASAVQIAAASIAMSHRRIGLPFFGSIDLTSLRVFGFHRQKMIDCYGRRCGGPRQPET